MHVYLLCVLCELIEVSTMLTLHDYIVHACDYEIIVSMFIKSFSEQLTSLDVSKT